jgi:3-isopropylmalate/(R)-2-methylmalate dehydratase small subunit
MANVDTDQIVPSRFIRKPRSAGFAPYLFYDLRFDEGGAERPEFVLNQPPWRDARIIVAERNFGCGASREQVVYALWDHGIRAVIAPSYGDIFYGNCIANAILPVVLPEKEVAVLLSKLAAASGARLAIDLDAQQVKAPDGAIHSFDIDPFRKHCLLNGIDEIGFTLQYRDQIARHAEESRSATPWM